MSSFDPPPLQALLETFGVMASQLEHVAGERKGVEKARALGGALAWREAARRLQVALAAPDRTDPDDQVSYIHHAVLSHLWKPSPTGTGPDRCRYCGGEAAEKDGEPHHHRDCSGIRALASAEALGAALERQRRWRNRWHSAAVRWRSARGLYAAFTLGTLRGLTPEQVLQEIRALLARTEAEPSHAPDDATRRPL